MQLDLKQVRQSFVSSTHDLLQRSEGLLLDLERSYHAEHIAELMRTFHTIKGNAGIFELEGVIRLCHALEDYLPKLTAEEKAIDGKKIDLLLSTLDRIRQMVVATDDGDKRQRIEYQDLLAALEHSVAATEAKQHEQIRGGVNIYGHWYRKSSCRKNIASSRRKKTIT